MFFYRSTTDLKCFFRNLEKHLIKRHQINIHAVYMFLLRTVEVLEQQEFVFNFQLGVQTKQSAFNVTFANEHTSTVQGYKMKNVSYLLHLFKGFLPNLTSIIHEGFHHIYCSEG